MRMNGAMKFLGVTRPTLQKWLDAGLIVYSQGINGSIEIDNASIEEFKYARLARINSRKEITK